MSDQLPTKAQNPILFSHVDPDGDRVELIGQPGALILRAEDITSQSLLVLLNKDAAYELATALNDFCTANVSREF